MTRGLGLGVLGAGYMRHTRDGARRGARRGCKSRGLEVVGCDVRREGKSRGRQGGEPGARGRIVTDWVLVMEYVNSISVGGDSVDRLPQADHGEVCPVYQMNHQAARP